MFVPTGADTFLHWCALIGGGGTTVFVHTGVDTFLHWCALIWGDCVHTGADTFLHWCALIWAERWGLFYLHILFLNFFSFIGFHLFDFCGNKISLCALAGLKLSLFLPQPQDTGVSGIHLNAQIFLNFELK